MENPSAIKQPKLQSPIKKGNGKGKGNQPYLRFRRKMRRDMF